MTTRRIKRVNSLLREVISETIRSDLKSQDQNELITITDVETSADLRHAKVFVSFIENDPKKKEEMLGKLNDKAKAIAAISSKKVVMRYFPELIFILDTALDNYMKIDTILKNLK
ncbi:MAG: ribosome-binding factor A [Chlamydiae bacterium RIFCSPHIGHO2_12_FULL_49_11]|nr:MAG: ribosome-binding factor A [Chlamydiae bacterium RIFCSPHIGHO2_12_FULL_49_11]